MLWIISIYNYIRLITIILYFIIKTPICILFFFFLNDTAPPEISPLPLHDALPISSEQKSASPEPPATGRFTVNPSPGPEPTSDAGPVPGYSGHSWMDANRTWGDAWKMSLVPDRKSTRLNSSHDQISYAVFCLKKKK